VNAGPAVKRYTATFALRVMSWRGSSGLSRP
jgi:hypothetical protein